MPSIGDAIFGTCVVIAVLGVIMGVAKAVQAVTYVCN